MASPFSEVESFGTGVAAVDFATLILHLLLPITSGISLLISVSSFCGEGGLPAIDFHSSEIPHKNRTSLVSLICSCSNRSMNHTLQRSDTVRSEEHTSELQSP